jgi:hypothetical protein
MAQRDPYNVFFMHSTLSSDSLGENMLGDPGFEDQTTNSVSAPWRVTGTGGVDRGLGFAHSGSNNGWMRNTSSTSWNALTQIISVTPNTTYTLTGWLMGSSNVARGYFGARTTSGTVFSEATFGSLPSYTQKSVSFNSGSNTSVTVYAGFWGPGADSWIRVDDLSVQ